MKIDEKAHDLFKEKPGQAPLTVTRIFKSDERNTKPFEKNREVLGLSDTKRLQNVRDNSPCLCAYFPVPWKL